MQVLHLAEGCLSDAGMLEALQACRQAAKLGDLLPGLLRVSYKLTSGQNPALSNTCRHSLSTSNIFESGTPESPVLAIGAMYIVCCQSEPSPAWYGHDKA